MIYKSIIFILILLIKENLSCEPRVKLNGNLICGQNATFMDFVVHQYLSVPYTEPPIAELRFKKPVPRLFYPKVLHAINIPPACHQYSENPYPWYINSPIKSEDCLYLNIWTPASASPENPKAVMYWIHGGGYRYGSIQSELYTGVPLAALGDIIVVTVNYRLGPFGFLTSGTEDAPGNAGIWDLLEGLKWVNRNIEFFGGDPQRVTLAGESAGSIAVGLLAVSPLARGLFRRQIMQSGAPTHLRAENNTQNIALSQQLSKTVGCASDEFTIQDNPEAVVKCLKKIDPIELSKADFLLNTHSTSDFIPQFGDAILPVNPRTAVLNGQFQCSELLIGNNQDETSFYITTGDPNTFGFFGEKDVQINKTTAASIIQKYFSDFPDTEAVIQHYLPDYIPEEAYDFVRYQAYTSLGDMTLICPDVYYAEKCAEKGSKVFFYFWTHRSSTTPWAPWMGVVHFSELDFLFGQPLLNPENYPEGEQKISRQMIKIWSNFVKAGKPGMPWPFYSSENPSFNFFRIWNSNRKHCPRTTQK